MKRSNTTVSIGGSGFGLIIILALISFFVYGNWNYVWPVIAFGFLTMLFMVLVVILLVAGIILGIFYIMFWSADLLSLLVLPASWITTFIVWWFVIIGSIINIVLVLFLIKAVVKRVRNRRIQTFPF